MALRQRGDLGEEVIILADEVPEGGRWRQGGQATRSVSVGIKAQNL